MSGLHHTDAIHRQGMTVFCDDKAVRDAFAENLLKHLSHFGARLAGPDDDNAALDGDRIAANNEQTIVHLEEVTNARGGICCIQRGCPNEPRGVTKCGDRIHFYCWALPGKFLAIRARICSTDARSVAFGFSLMYASRCSSTASHFSSFTYTFASMRRAALKLGSRSRAFLNAVS